MLDFVYHPNWTKISDFLMAGRPPILAQLLALNALFLAITAVRRAAGARQLSAGAAFLAQMGMLGANIAVLFEQQVLDFFRPFMW